MKIAAQLLLPSLAFLACVAPSAANACAIVPKEQMAERYRQSVEKFKAATIALEEKSDLIFVGRLARLRTEDDTVELPSGQRQVVQRHEATFDVDDTIKGQYPNGGTLAFTGYKDRVVVTVGCGPQFWRLPDANGVHETYLVYAQDGKILRTNRIPKDAQVLGGQEEAAFVRARR
ncbi:hypothetical protein QPK32_21385 [Massilia sp. YIM B02763]|uniref:hypothetical protein n=1 Tax=Massilia sp. YIM B02763 TaxID=3050130 RepID=UPI0025B65A95|nr:hypothetical protein [Massilia sp. YIM B02763]MDN4055628.1 hypothetical protein [Massilia sp. YIM B02763]